MFENVLKEAQHWLGTSGELELVKYYHVSRTPRALLCAGRMIWAGIDHLLRCVQCLQGYLSNIQQDLFENDFYNVILDP